MFKITSFLNSDMGLARALMNLTNCGETMTQWLNASSEQRRF